MWKFLGVMSVFNFIILLTLITLSGGGPITFKYVMEGDSIKHYFDFPCTSAEITLRQGHKAPFYDSTNPESMLLSDRYKLSLRNETEDQNCSLQLEINPVHRSDVGAYILTFYDGQGNFLEDSKIGLRVDYPPGVASCEWLEENIVDDWGSMLCKATAGSTPGIIACYQNGIRLPPKTTPTETGNFLQQTIWVRYSQVTFCCASLQERVIEKCECKDFIWDTPQNTTDPSCPDAAPLQDLSNLKSAESGDKKDLSVTDIPSTSQTITKLTSANKHTCIRLQVVIGFLSFVIILGFVRMIHSSVPTTIMVPTFKHRSTTYGSNNKWSSLHGHSNCGV